MGLRRKSILLICPRQSLRRVALRSAASAARVAAPKAPTNQFASQFASSKITVKQSTVSLARYFSQTVRVAAEETNGNAEPEEATITAEHVESEAQQPETTDVERPAERTQRRPNNDLPNGIFVRNFVFDVTEGHLTQMLSKFGDVTEARIVRDARGLSKGYVSPLPTLTFGSNLLVFRTNQCSLCTDMVSSS